MHVISLTTVTSRNYNVDKLTLKFSNGSNRVWHPHQRTSTPLTVHASASVQRVQKLYLDSRAVVLTPISSSTPQTLQSLLRLVYDRVMRHLLKKCLSRSVCQYSGQQMVA